ncbi:MAG TPA: hypothetical protein VL053_13490 [Arachidicoccus sp.]|nr:hypothetical protein [Arachidicoccus sp.]
MYNDDTKEKLENVICGTVLEGTGDSCAAIRNHLCRSFETSPTIKREFEGRAVVKEKQAECLREYCQQNGLWLTALPKDANYLTQGGESKVYLNGDRKSVLKLNDSVYYATWLEFFNSLVIHNLLFEVTAYACQGFIEIEGALYVVLKQDYVKADGEADLEDIKEVLNFNGFKNIKRNDYFNQDFDLLLEDMHDENVITTGGKLFFIDTVFYITRNGKI